MPQTLEADVERIQDMLAESDDVRDKVLEVDSDFFEKLERALRSNSKESVRELREIIYQKCWSKKKKRNRADDDESAHIAGGVDNVPDSSNTVTVDAPPHVPPAVDHLTH